MKPYFFVLGAPDHEAREIARVCEELGLPFGWATIGGNIVHSHDAYEATGVTTRVPPNAHIVFVECFVLGLIASDRVDHHHEGDPGYGMPPEQYFDGSSLGQFLRMVKVRPTQAQLIIAAADHCLTAAYQGRCPGVSPLDLAAWRIKSRCMARGLSEEELTRQIGEASAILQTAPTVVLAQTKVAFLEEPPLEVSEASARMAMPYIYVRRQDAKRIKSGIRSAPPEVVQAWMDKCGLQNMYGDPQRGFAGGYHYV
jgi:hypothetical protein